MTGTGKSFTVKSWFANKVAAAVEHNITSCDVFAILKETEKAVYAMLSIGGGSRWCMWIPKSALVEREVHVAVGEPCFYETMKTDSYTEAFEAFKVHWKAFI